jgi:F5/8 type C domain-containing protein
VIVIVALALAAAISLAHAGAPSPPPTLIDGFEDARAWQPMPSDGVTLALSNEPGIHGRCMRMDVAFAQGGYAIAHHAVKLAIADNYELAFWIRGAIRSNQLELKLIDTSGENVWWHMEPDFTFPRDWTHVVVRARKIGFAWGPKGGGPPRDIAAIELVVTAGAGHPGGKGSVWLDDLTLRELPARAPIDTAYGPHGELRGVTAAASQHAPGHAGTMAVDGDSATSWRSAGAGAATLTLDLHAWREYGGLTAEWNPAHRPARYEVQASDDARTWRTLRSVNAGHAARDVMMLPDAASRWLRLTIPAGPVALREVHVMPPAWGDSREPMLRDLAAHSPRGSFPRWLVPEPVRWAIAGVPGALDVPLLSADGAIELGRGGPTLEPFVIVNGRTWNWASVRAVPALGPDDAAPSLTWKGIPGVDLSVSLHPAGGEDDATVWATFALTNTSRSPVNVTLLLALRPWQVNPPWQFLGVPGGLAPLHAIRTPRDSVIADGWRLHVFSVDGTYLRIPPTRLAARGADALLPSPPAPREPRETRDPGGLASAVMAWDWKLPPHGRATAVTIELALPQDDSLQRIAIEPYHSRYERPASLGVPGSDRGMIAAFQASRAWIRALRSGPALRPGARAYARSWIRDGAMMADVLLRAGQTDEARTFAGWFASHQYPNGKVPCCVDARGADPVPEHDSHGELIYAIADVVRHTGDVAWARPLMPHVAAAVAYMDSLRARRLTPEYDRPGMRRYRGLFPPSISHEGYSARPMHSYWDDLWGLRGYRDAVWLAERTGDAALATHARDAAKQFAHDITASIESTDVAQHIDYVPGCADLGDFDATSEAIASSPLDVTDVLPPRAFRNTIDRYMRFFRARADSEAFTPYEMRIAGTLARMGRGAEARELLNWFMRYRDPPEWQQWPEVVWHDTTATKFIGDLPHGWVAAEFCRSVMDLFAFERGRDSSLVVAAGVDPAWLDSAGVRVDRLSTEYGSISYGMRRDRGHVSVDLAAFPVVPRGGVVVQIPGAQGGEKVSGAAGVTAVARDGTVRLRVLPAKFSVALRSP